MLIQQFFDVINTERICKKKIGQNYIQTSGFVLKYMGFLVRSIMRASVKTVGDII